MIRQTVVLVIITCLNIGQVRCQENTNFQKDAITQKFRLSQIVEVPGKTKLDIIKAMKDVGNQLLYSPFDKKEGGVLSKAMNVTYNPNENLDSSRLFYKVQISQVSKTNLKARGYKSYISLIMDMHLYIKDGKYKIELTNFNVSGGDIKLSGLMDATEEKNSENKNWIKTKEEIYKDGIYVKQKVIDGIMTYFKKSDF